MSDTLKYKRCEKEDILKEVVSIIIIYLDSKDSINLLKVCKKISQLFQYKNIRKIILSKFLLTHIGNKAKYENKNRKLMSVLPAFGCKDMDKLWHKVFSEYYITMHYRNVEIKCNANVQHRIYRLGDTISSFSVDKDISYLLFTGNNSKIIRFKNLVKHKKYVLGNHYLSDFPIISTFFVDIFIESSDDVVLNIVYSNLWQSNELVSTHFTYCLANKREILFSDNMIGYI